MAFFMGLDPKISSRPTTIRIPAVILIYLMQIAAGLAFFWHIEPVILQSQTLMRLIGFNGREILDGTSRQGRKKTDAVDGTAQTNMMFLLLVTDTVTLPIGMRFYRPDPKCRAWKKEDKRLAKSGVKASKRPKAPEPDPNYPSKTG